MAIGLVLLHHLEILRSLLPLRKSLRQMSRVARQSLTPRPKRFSVGTVLGALLAAFYLSQACAANITVEKTTNGPVIIVTGTLNPQDGEAFANQISGLSNGVVLLSSPGGSLGAGLRIGQLVQLKSFVTVVPDGAACASACAFAWLGGLVRFMGPKALIGFHAAYRIENGRATETGAGNALVGAYLSRLGLSDAAIFYITSAPPTDITWLKIEDARNLGIEVAILAPTVTDHNSGANAMAGTPSTRTGQPSQPSQAPVVGSKKVQLDEVARTFAINYFAHWSENNAEALNYFTDVYAETINFYDRPVPRDALLKEKRKFAERWPDRIYTANPESINTDCNIASSKCVVTGQVGWDCRNARLDLRSSGLAKFTLQISVSHMGSVQIVGEWSSVVSRE